MTKTEIANNALLFLGQLYTISNLDDDTSAEGIAIRQVYDKTNDELLRANFWSFSRSFRKLVLVEQDPLEDLNDANEFEYSYLYPTDCLYIKRVVNEIGRVPVRQEQVTYWKAFDATNQRLLIYTNMEDAVIEYTSNDVPIELYPPEYCFALSRLIAYKIGLAIMTSNTTANIENLYKQYRQDLKTAIARDANEQQYDELPRSEFLRARTGYGTAIDQRAIGASDPNFYQRLGYVQGRI